MQSGVNVKHHRVLRCLLLTVNIHRNFITQHCGNDNTILTRFVLKCAMLLWFIVDDIYVHIWICIYTHIVTISSGIYINPHMVFVVCRHMNAIYTHVVFVTRSVCLDFIISHEAIFCKTTFQTILSVAGQSVQTRTSKTIALNWLKTIGNYISFGLFTKRHGMAIWSALLTLCKETQKSMNAWWYRNVYFAHKRWPIICICNSRWSYLQAGNTWHFITKVSEKLIIVTMEAQRQTHRFLCGLCPVDRKQEYFVLRLINNRPK